MGKGLTVAGVWGLLALTAVGLSGWDQTAVTTGLLNLDTAREWGLAVGASLAWVVGLTFVLARTRQDARYLPALRLVLLVYAVLLVGSVAVMGGARTVLASRIAQENRRVLPQPDQQDSMRLPFVGEPPEHLLEIALGTLLLLLGLVAVLMFPSWRWFALRQRSVREARFGRGSRGSATPEQVADALVRARRALLSDEDVRRAIVAAYAAMEGAVAQQGVERRVTETAGEFLHDALDHGVLHDPDAVRSLLRLFHLARFSHEPLHTGAVHETDAVLATLQADLERTGVPR